MLVHDAFPNWTRNYKEPAAPSFTSAEEYRTYRRAWRTDYKELSSGIRRLKISVKETMRSGNYAGHKQNALRVKQDEARTMMLELADAKTKLKALDRIPEGA